MSSEFRAALESGDVKYLLKIWGIVAPHLPQPTSLDQAEIIMHRARTESESITFKSRAYSHRWLSERLLPSGLPDNLKPSAERMYPKVTEGVGIAVLASKEYLKPAVIEIRKSMEDVVHEAYAEKKIDHILLRSRIQEARRKTQKILFG